MFVRSVPTIGLSRFIGAAVLVIAGLVAGSPRASADSVTLKFDQTTASAGVKVQYTIGGVASVETAVPGPYYWTPTTQPLNSTFPNPTSTFCASVHRVPVGLVETGLRRWDKPEPVDWQLPCAEREPVEHLDRRGPRSELAERSGRDLEFYLLDQLRQSTTGLAQ